MPDNSDVFDYVIVGAGTAGSILTNRLSTDGARVCLLEAGPEDYHPFIHSPSIFQTIGEKDRTGQ